MALEFKLPVLGDGFEAGNVMAILVGVGDSVEANQELIEVEAGKATVAVPSPAAGKVTEILVNEGDKVTVGSLILKIEEGANNGNKSSKEPVKATSAQAEVVKAENKTSPAVAKLELPTPAATPVTPSASAATADERAPLPAAPSVRKFAREIGVDLHGVLGSGPGGRIGIDDVKTVARQSSGGGVRALAAPRLPDFAKYGEIDRESMNQIRIATAQNLGQAWATIPHVTQFDEADVTELEELRKKFGPKVEAQGAKLTVTAILLKVVGSALKVFPKFNASIDIANQEVVYKKYYNVGVAVDTERGLVVPVVRQVDRKNIVALAKELGTIAQKARDRKLGMDDMQGSNFTISNLGGLNGKHFTPIVNPPEVAILGVGRAAYKPVYVNGQFVPRLLCPLALSYDHRLIDGADGTRFLRWIVEALEQPFVLQLEG